MSPLLRLNSAISNSSKIGSCHLPKFEEQEYQLFWLCWRSVHHVRYVEGLLAWPMPLDGRQGDIRCALLGFGCFFRRLYRTPHSLHLNSLTGSMALSIREHSVSHLEPSPNLWVNSSPLSNLSNLSNLYIVTAFVWGVVAVAVTASQLSLVVEIGAEYLSRQCTCRILGTWGRTNTFSFRFQMFPD